MDLEQIKEEVKRVATNGVLTCHDARALAEELGVEYGLIGKACDEVSVKIRVCELGCF